MTENSPESDGLPEEDIDMADLTLMVKKPRTRMTS
jgi:hypothetical protein